jgi:membrane-bound ClpP family serine protease
MNRLRDHNAAGAAMAGLLLFGVPVADLLLGNAFTGVHAVVGLSGMALLVVTLLAPHSSSSRK